LVALLNEFAYAREPGLFIKLHVVYACWSWITLGAVHVCSFLLCNRSNPTEDCLRMCATLLARGSNSRPVGYIGFGHVAIMSLMSGQALIQPRRSGNTKAPCVAQPSTAASRVITTASTSTTPGSRTLPAIAAAQKPRGSQHLLQLSSDQLPKGSAAECS
jgi:hypothetical protein